MAEIDYSENHHANPADDFGVPSRTEFACFNCGSKHPAAYWSPDADPDRPLVVCRPCATEVLPMLIADAVAAHAHRARPIRNDFADAVKSVELNFWRAASAATRRAYGRLWNHTRELTDALSGEDLDV